MDRGPIRRARGYEGVQFGVIILCPLVLVLFYYTIDFPTAKDAPIRGPPETESLALIGAGEVVLSSVTQLSHCPVASGLIIIFGQALWEHYAGKTESETN